MWMKRVRELCKNTGMFLFTIFQNSPFFSIIKCNTV